MNSKTLSTLLMMVGLLLAPLWGHAETTETLNMDEQQTLDQRQQALVPVAAFAAAGDLDALKGALNQALDAGMTVNDGKEVLVQLYAYAGFPRSLNALGSFMGVLAERREQGIEDAEGDTPQAPIPTGDALLKQGTANQTKLAGGPVKGPLFEFAPAADEYLKTHLFGDIFARDNLSWQDREIATIAMLSAIPGAEPQLQAHMGIGMNAGLTPSQLQQLVEALKQQVGSEQGERAATALSAILND
ncbi:carboxymuconolactone decarboxylase family protein [Alcanivorax sp. S6407]|uniref:carboxymuconolactone decarboxylase family protein n=1 Tax=Alcanivorax sp. S6407 TaxID=2926424 RepID=UPI001FF47351|nr:carboxymuconolactone decarboxylase family protein [Alcanivorax sp. S6407]MCK0154828.1 carboxymuconolactone decarboxylase family protein [Alcanivorax sp. S6407]